MKELILSLFFAMAFSTASARPLLPSKPDSSKTDANIHKASAYAVSDWSRLNWIYLGLAPRATDPNRVGLTISTAGFTLRVTMEMTEAEVAAYPRYLLARAAELSDIIEKRKLEVKQPTLWKRYLSTVNSVRQLKLGDYQTGLALLNEFFPGNIFELPQANAKGARVIAHFVYPITINSAKAQTAPDGRYRTYYFEERKSIHQTKYIDPETQEERLSAVDYVFGGQPAMFFYASTNGIGVHGPIRFSNRGENLSTPKMKQEDFWAQSEPKNFGYDKQVDIKANIRWDLVRKADSSGCIRAEVMEIRHLLPSLESDLKRVTFTVTSKLDEVAIEGKIYFVNVDYYLVDPYKIPLTKEQWLKQIAPKLANLKAEQVMDFPYLDPSTVEFVNPSGSGDYQAMSALNQAPVGVNLTN